MSVPLIDKFLLDWESRTRIRGKVEQEGIQGILFQSVGQFHLQIKCSCINFLKLIDKGDMG